MGLFGWLKWLNEFFGSSGGFTAQELYDKMDMNQLKSLREEFDPNSINYEFLDELVNNQVPDEESFKDWKRRKGY